jgi:hypothetical protein
MRDGIVYQGAVRRAIVTSRHGQMLRTPPGDTGQFPLISTDSERRLERRPEVGGSAVTTPPARPEEPRNWYRDVEHRPGGLHVLARRPLVRVVRDARDSAELVRVVPDITRWTINLPSAAETPKGHGEPSWSDCLGTDGTPVCGPDQAEAKSPQLTRTQRRRHCRTPPAAIAAVSHKLGAWRSGLWALESS